jgi:hypothetical protein
MIVDRAVYSDGRRTAEPDDFAELRAACQKPAATRNYALEQAFPPRANRL